MAKMLHDAGLRRKQAQRRLEDCATHHAANAVASVARCGLNGIQQRGCVDVWIIIIGDICPALRVIG
jgi:hypothetical protein